MARNVRLSAFALTAALVLTGCGNAVAPITPVSPTILAAPTQVTVGGESLRLEASLWRDFQPGDTDSSLRALVRLRAESGRDISARLRIDQVWLVFDGDAWVSTPQERAPGVVGTLEMVSRGGPLWPVGATVTVVARVRDSDNTTHLVRAAAQTILRTD